MTKESENNFLYLKQSSNLNLINRVREKHDKKEAVEVHEGKTKTLVRFQGDFTAKTLQLNDLLLSQVDLKTGEGVLSTIDVTACIPFNNRTPLKDLEEEIMTLCTLAIGFKKGKNSVIMPIFKYLKIEEGKILRYEYNDKFFNYLKSRKCRLMAYNDKILNLDCRKNKNPYTYFLSRKLMELQRMNFSKEWMNVSAETLLNLCKQVGMKDWKKVKATRRNEYIITPLLSSLEVLKNEGIIEFSNSALEDKKINFSKFLKSSFKIRLIDYPKFRIEGEEIEGEEIEGEFIEDDIEISEIFEAVE